MKKKICSLMLIFSMIAVFIPAELAAAQNIQSGDYIIFGRYLETPLLWRCVDIDENGPLMLSDEIIALKAFDEKGGNTDGSHGRTGGQRYTYGSNYWADSNIRSWLNSSAQAGYVEWECGNPPKYAKEAGFLANFTTTELKSIKSVTQKSLLDGYEYNAKKIDDNYHKYNNKIYNVLQEYDEAYSEEVEDLVFLLDVKQINTVYNNFGDYYIGTLSELVVPSEPTPEPTPIPEPTPTPDPSIKPTKTPRPPKTPEPTKRPDYAGDKYGSWLRSPRGRNVVNKVDSPGIQVRYVTKDGLVNATEAFKSDCGIRPAFYLNEDDTTFESGTGTKDNPYVIAMGDDDSPINQPLPSPTPEPSDSPSPDSPTNTPSGNETDAPSTDKPTNTPSGNETDTPSPDKPTNTPSGNTSDTPSPDKPTNTPSGSQTDTPSTNGPKQTPSGNQTSSQPATPVPTLTPSGHKSVSPIGKYAGKMKIDMETDNNQILFTITSSDTADLSGARLFIAAYNPDGSLKSVDIGDNVLFGNKLMIVTDIHSTGMHKLMLMDNELCPLMNAETINTAITLTP